VIEPFGRGSICYKPYVGDGSAKERIDDLLRQAEEAEAAGFDGIAISEHHLGFPGYLPNPLQAASWILAHTSRIWVAPAPMLLLLRPLNLVAEELAWLSARHPGRVAVGFAAGSMIADFELVGSNQDDLTARYESALREVVPTLAGDPPRALRADPALDLLASHPIPAISAASSHTACRRAASVGCGILLESAVAEAEVARMVGTYRNAGGTGAVVLVRRVWVGDDPPIALEAERDALVRSTVPVYKRDSWLAPSDMIISGSAEQLAQRLGAVIEATGADALNLRVHVPGLAPSVVQDQVAALADVLTYVRGGRVSDRAPRGR